VRVQVKVPVKEAMKTPIM
ncbi:hypothetical protein A2U01_0065864, partial [Trifolium medium]|nr:hypothetical protein [Trifolium medium]